MVNELVSKFFSNFCSSESHQAAAPDFPQSASRCSGRGVAPPNPSIPAVAGSLYLGVSPDSEDERPGSLAPYTAPTSPYPPPTPHHTSSSRGRFDSQVPALVSSLRQQYSKPWDSTSDRFGAGSVVIIRAGGCRASLPSLITVRAARSASRLLGSVTDVGPHPPGPQ
jgi:hypothetical protein